MPFRAPGLLSTLCTAFYALIGMLLRGGKTAEGREFLQNFGFFIYSYFVCFRMFVTFTYLFFRFSTNEGVFYVSLCTANM